MTFTAPDIAIADDRPTGRPAGRFRRVWLAIVTGGLLAVGLCQWLQPDPLAAVTAIPPWSWLSAWTLLALPALWNASWRQRAFALAVAVAFLVLSVEQTRSVGRSIQDLTRSGSAEPAAIRVVTINCNVGSNPAADEVTAHQPDLVLLQESPDEASATALAQALFGEQAAVAWSSDCAILARGALRPAAQQDRHFLQATWTQPGGALVEVVCVRLEPPLVRFDLWSPACWREHAAQRRKHREQAQAIAAALAQAPAETPILVGGDFNAPAGDGALQELSPRLRDAFESAGRGWGATVLNRVPVHRFDQLWCSEQLAPRKVWSAFSANSDHRLVVGEFDFAPVDR